MFVAHRCETRLHTGMHAVLAQKNREEDVGAVACQYGPHSNIGNWIVTNLGFASASAGTTAAGHAGPYRGPGVPVCEQL